MLPCKNEQRVIEQVGPTVRLLSNMDALHPEVLRQHAIEPSDYKDGLVFRSAVERIRGSFIASSMTGRQQIIADTLESLQQRHLITDYEASSSRARYDFSVAIRRKPDYFAAVEVKGGEGNSINISERPMWAREFALWCHLDGAIVNQPGHGAHSIINRVTNELVRRGKLVDVVFFKDKLCGTPARPCPKYPGMEREIGANAAPDVFLLPQHVPAVGEPCPGVHSLKTLKLAALVLRLFGVDEGDASKHIWQVYVELDSLPNSRVRRRVQVFHEGQVVAESISRSWAE